MRKSVIATTAMIAIVTILAASFVWYNNDGGGGSDTTEDSEPVLSNYINTSSFFEAYKDGAMISVFKSHISSSRSGTSSSFAPTTACPASRTTATGPMHSHSYTIQV